MNIKIVLIAGEPSGDSIGANLIKSILKEIPSTEFFGIGGEKMIGISAPLREERTIEREYSKKVFSSWFPMEDIAIMGFIEIAHKLLSIRKRINETIENILRCDPDVVITIDSPGFSTRVVKALRDRCFIKPILHYVAPTVWAYNPERAKKFAQLYDHMLCILPFEKHYFDKVGLDATFVGHPVLENSDIKSNKNDVKKKYGIDQSTKLLTVTPGSRVGELNRHLHIFRKAVQLIKQKEKNIKIFVPTLPHLKNRIEEAFDDAIISDDSKIKSELSYASDAAIIKSGTVVIEMMKRKIPMIVSYKVSQITAFFLKRKLLIKYLTICNIILDQEIIPELIQNKCTAENIASNIINILNDNKLQEQQFRNFEKVLNELMPENNEGKLPSEIAAKVMMKYLPQNSYS